MYRCSLLLEDYIPHMPDSLRTNSTARVRSTGRPLGTLATASCHSIIIPKVCNDKAITERTPGFIQHVIRSNRRSVYWGSKNITCLAHSKLQPSNKHHDLKRFIRTSANTSPTPLHVESVFERSKITLTTRQTSSFQTSDPPTSTRTLSHTSPVSLLLSSLVF